MYQAFTEYVDRLGSEELPAVSSASQQRSIYKNFSIAQLISSPDVNTRDYPTSEAYTNQLYENLLQDVRTVVLPSVVSEEDVRLFFREGELE